MMRCRGAHAIALAWATMALATAAPFTHEMSGDLGELFAEEVPLALQVPVAAQEAYADRLRDALQEAGLLELAPQHFLLVDRNPQVQAGFLYRSTPGGAYRMTGAFPVSTGLPGSYEHFATPLGVFEHSLANPDFRAEGTVNENGIRGYGARGMRVFDFGWVRAAKGWGDRAESDMRLQVHATDPRQLEPLLGRARSKGCVRIPAAVNEFIDRRGVLDAAYEEAAMAGRPHWVLRPDREATRWPGRYLVVVDSGVRSRPEWSPSP